MSDAHDLAKEIKSADWKKKISQKNQTISPVRRQDGQ